MLKSEMLKISHQENAEQANVEVLQLWTKILNKNGLGKKHGL